MNEQILFTLAKKGDKTAKEKIVSDNTGLVWSIARRFIGRGYDLEEIYQIGCVGLLKAIDRFDLCYDVKFSTYAVPMITGEIKRFLRDNGAIKVSRIIKQNGYLINKMRENFINEKGREPTIFEIINETGLNEDEIVIATEANREIESLYQSVFSKDGNEITLVEKIADDSNQCQIEEKIINNVMLENALGSLDAKQRKLIKMRFFLDKTQSEVAKELGITQVQVSRLEKKLLVKMRNSLTKNRTNSTINDK